MSYFIKILGEKILMRKGFFGGSSTLKKSYLTGYYTRILMKATKTSLVISLFTSFKAFLFTIVRSLVEVNQAIIA